MSVEKTFKGVRLSDEELLVIQNIQEKYGLSNFSQTISYLIREYPHLQEENEKLREENRKQMTRIRLASNGADENGQVLLEVLIHYVGSFGLMSTALRNKCYIQR